jgi:hypothetical protein
MKFLLLSIGLLTCCATAFGQSEKPRLVFVRHLEPPAGYENLARQARIQGTVVAKLTIASDGSVLRSAVSWDGDPALQKTGLGLLGKMTTELVNKWTFGCFDCLPGESYEHTIRFVFKIEGNPQPYPTSKVSMDLPNEVTITTTPPTIEH